MLLKKIYFNVKQRSYIIETYNTLDVWGAYAVTHDANRTFSFSNSHFVIIGNGLEFCLAQRTCKYKYQEQHIKEVAEFIKPGF